MRRIVLGAVMALALLGGAHAQDKGLVSAAERDALAGPWRGAWTGGDYAYDGEITLTVAPAGGVEGEIRWTLRETPYPEEEAKIGLEGVEHVRGRYDPSGGSLTLEGYRLDDPHEILGTDSYRLVVGGNHALLVGLTANHGTWDGLVTMER